MWVRGWVEAWNARPNAQTERHVPLWHNQVGHNHCPLFLTFHPLPTTRTQQHTRVPLVSSPVQRPPIGLSSCPSPSSPQLVHPFIQSWVS